MYSTLVYLVFSQLAVGGLLSMLAVPLEAGKRFFRFCALACLVFLLLALWAGPFPLLTPTADASRVPPLPRLLLAVSALIGFGYLLAVVAERKKPQKPLLAAAGVVGAAGLVTDGFFSCEACSPVAAGALTAASYLISALFLGSVIFAMILGHWYLVVPALHIRPLRILTQLMLGATLAKVMLTALTLWVFWAYGDTQLRETLQSFRGLGGLFLWVRLLFGLLGPLIVGFMVWQTVKIHSTQSATGLLYVATIFVLIGECVSGYILYTTGIPV
ncbi:MAG: hypothetical protein OXR72_09700 [Gemmatimonadota bacterium]|nr:hypothetical protein [Gemmatimonadota bacterium]